MKNKENVHFNRNPFKGIFEEIAKVMSTTAVNARNKFNNKDIETIRVFNKISEGRLVDIKKSETLLREMKNVGLKNRDNSKYTLVG